VSYRVFSPRTETGDEYTNSLATKSRFFRHPTRQREPLDPGHPGTGRALLIKVAAEVVVVSTRRVLAQLSSSWPHRGWYRRVCERLRRPVPTAVPQASG
jgi:hypothetical protein